MARLTIRHDGTSCGCDGLCLFDEYIDKPLEPWTEVRLSCTDHSHECQVIAEDGLHQPPVRTLEHPA